MSIWSHATKKDPCPICGKEDWCTFGERAMLCQRVESERPAANGGWYHHYEKSNLRVTNLPKPKPAPAPLQAATLMSQMAVVGLDSLAQSLGITAQSLEWLGCAWSNQHRAWAFPMCDGHGLPIGIRLRADSGQKWAVTGSRQGIFMPKKCNLQVTKIAYLPEGPTDTAALLSMGLFAIGRPNNLGGGEQIAQALKHFGIGRVVVVADNDEIKQGGKRPGMDGAVKLKKLLKLPSVIWCPPMPIKDVREFYRKGGTRQMIENEIKNKVWTRL